MRFVEQAIYTSIETDDEAGYQVLARSPGVCDIDARELVVWEPSSDAMLDSAADAESFNFHPLPSGAYCVSRSTPAGWEGGGGRKVYTHCLIVPPEVLAPFANNPFALIRAMSKEGLWRNPSTLCPRLDPFYLPGGAAPVDQKLLQELALNPGPQRMAALIQQACNAVCLAIGGAERPMSLMAGLFHCLPIECRLDFSFSTGLRFSPWRPFRMVAISDDPAEKLWVASYSNIVVLDMGKNPATNAIPLDGWATLVERALATEHIPFLASQIAKRRFELTLGDLPALGLQLLETLDRFEYCGDPRWRTPMMAGQCAHAAHRQFEKSRHADTATLSNAAGVNHSGQHSQEILDQLEYLDDLVYDVISEQNNSLEQLRAVWSKLLSELGDNAMLAESREQYLRYALSIWNECAEGGAMRDPARAIHVLNVLCLLFGESD